MVKNIDPLILYTFIEHSKNEKFICKLNPKMIVTVLNVDEKRNVTYEGPGGNYTLNMLAFIGLFAPLNYPAINNGDS